MRNGELLRRRIAPEFEGLRLGDKRLESRVTTTVDALARDPAASVRAAARSTAEAEAMYRLLRNRRVSMESLLEPHLVRTAKRCSAASKVLVVHDTSEFKFNGDERTGLGRLSTKGRQGFLFHASFAVEAGSREPLGLLASKVWTRGDEATSVAQGRNGPRKKSGSDYARSAHKESDRWAEQIAASSQRLPVGRSVVHVADREADIYALFLTLQERRDRYVIRLARNKKVRQPGADAESIVELATSATGRFQIEVPIARRTRSAMPRTAKTFGAREARTARLEFAATSAEIVAPKYAAPASLPINIVHVREPDPPEGENAIEWFLLTSEPIDTDDAVREIADIYRTRWIIEEFFKALKTGCAMEDRELESLHTLTNALGLCVPIAYQLLALRSLARSAPDAPAERIFSPAQLAILHAQAKLPPNPTAQQALVAVAYLGSHFEPFHRKPPGWRVLARGMERLLERASGWSVRDSEDPIKR